MRNLFIALGVSLALTSAVAQTPAPAAPAPPPVPDAQADAVARRMMDMVAPDWSKVRYISFTFSAVRGGQVTGSFPQRWDRASGNYRLSGIGPMSVPFEVIMNTKTRQGRVWRDAQLIQDSQLLEAAYQRFVGDVHWLLMPLKVFDPGVHREYVGERSDSCGTKWDLLKLTFDPGAGLTEGDQAWMWVNRDTGLVDEWDMKLMGSNPDEPALRIYFHDYKRINGVLLATRRELRNGNQEIRFENVTFSPDVPKGAFDK
jgi:hypothetical protein